MISKTKNAIRYTFYNKLFRFFQRLGITITPNHYYYPIPDVETLPDELWYEKSELVGVDLRDETQIKLLNDFYTKYKNEYDQIPVTKTEKPGEFYLNNGSYQFVDACIYYCMIRENKPKRIIEIGAGNSTLLAIKGLLKNQEETGHLGDLISIEPYPNALLKNGILGLSKLYEKKLEDIDTQIFGELESNDILFIDSSHVLRIGGDVKRIYLDILPKLNKGVLVHIHDVFMPYEYPKEWVYKYLYFWNEQYVLQSFLTFNNSFEIIWAGNYIKSDYPKKLAEAFTTFDPISKKVASFWIKKIL